jgi:predicted nucleotidyltransferase
VRVDTNNSHNSTRGLIKSLVIDLLVKEEANEECIEIKVIIKDLEEKLFSEFTTIPNLLERIAESLGYKHYDPDVLAEKIKSKDKNLLHLYEMQLFLSKILANELDAQGFDPRKKSFSQTWDKIFIPSQRKFIIFTK